MPDYLGIAKNFAKALTVSGLFLLCSGSNKILQRVVGESKVTMSENGCRPIIIYSC